MRKEKVLIIRLIVALILWLVGIALSLIWKVKSNPNFNRQELICFILIILAYLTAGIDVIISALKKLFSGELLQEDFLMMIASLSAILLLFLGEREYIEAAGIMIFYQIGELFQTKALDKSRKNINDAIKFKVTKVHLLNGTELDPEKVMIGTEIFVNAFESVPIDGILLNDGIINQASLTGEAIDKYVEKGDLVLSGSLNQNIPLKIKTTKLYADSTTAKIMEMVESATIKKAKVEKVISKFAKIYTPIVVGLAFIFGVIIPTSLGIFNGFTKELYTKYLYIAILCLVVSCPCALVISVPLTYFSSIGAASKNKIIIKGSTYLDALAKTNVLVTDKTGTLTKGAFKVIKTEGDIVMLAKALENGSTHPLAKAILKLPSEDVNIYAKMKTTELPGFGVKGEMDDDIYLIGSYHLMEKEQIEAPFIPGHVLYVTKNKKAIGYFVLADELKDEAKDAIDELQQMHKHLIILSGDENINTKKTADELNITEFYAPLLPLDKVKHMENIKNQEQEKGYYCTYVGDGINDAPVLKIADCGISMGQASSDAAIEASDIVILNDNLLALPKLFKIANKNKRIITQNIIISLFLKVVVLILAILANFINIKVPMGLAIFADVGTLIIAILNSLRAFKITK